MELITFAKTYNVVQEFNEVLEKVINDYYTNNAFVNVEQSIDLSVYEDEDGLLYDVSVILIEVSPTSVIVRLASSPQNINDLQDMVDENPNAMEEMLSQFVETEDFVMQIQDLELLHHSINLLTMIGKKSKQRITKRQ